MIKLTHLTCGYGELLPIKDLSLLLPDKGVIAVSGPSGCGKSTLIKALSGLITPVKGEITGMPERLSEVFQEDRLLPWLNVWENVAFVRPEGDIAACIDAVELVREKTEIASLSGGMKRRVAIARAMNYGGDAVLLDEPFKGLDEPLARRVMERIKACFPLVIITVHGDIQGADMTINL
ncbi:MAG: ATP-binding cassette domain-containing protein [Clostridia bacterium]